MTIWVVGDSYATHRKESKKYKHLEDTWIERTGRLLNQNIVSHAKFSITVEYIFHKFNNISNDIKDNDIVIITLPYFVRRWHFRKNPLRIFFPSAEEQEAIDCYNESLTHYNTTHEIYLLNFLHHLNYLSKNLNLHTIAIPTFFDVDDILKPVKDDFQYINFSTNSLSEISIAEIKKECYDEKLNEWLQVHDPRVNHMLRSNHIILSDKIINNIKHNTSIDLKNGFNSNLFDFNISQDKEFISNELFDGIMERTHRIKLNNLL